MAQPLAAESKTAGPDRHGVEERSAWIVEDEELHELPRALRAGVRRMRELAKNGKYMLPNPGELEIVDLGGDQTISTTYAGIGKVTSPGAYGTFTAYDLRVSRSSMPNPWARSIRASARLPFRSRIQLDGWEPELMGVERLDPETGKLAEKKRGWVHDIDGEGRSLDQWAAESFEDSLFEGIVYGFVDNDPRKFRDPQSRRLAGARPYLAKILRCDVVRISIGISQGGTPRILQFVFHQPVKYQDFSDPGAWVDEERDALKVVTAGDKTTDEQGRSTTRPITTQVFVLNDAGKEYIHDPSRDGKIIAEGGNELLDIPLVPFYGKRVGPWRGHSPYGGDSAEMQVAIWNHTSELLNKARETALSYLYEAGVPGVEREGRVVPIDAGKQTLRYRWSTNPQGDLKFVEQSGQSLESLKDLVMWLVSQVEAEHHAINSEKPSAPVTAREITLEGVHATSFLEMVTLFHEHGWQRVLELMALLGGHKTVGTSWISKNFGLPNASMDRNKELLVAGKMTRGNYYAMAEAAGDVNTEDGFNRQAEIDAEEAESKSLTDLLTPLPAPAEDETEPPMKGSGSDGMDAGDMGEGDMMGGGGEGMAS